jgi:hypothetical protein
MCSFKILMWSVDDEKLKKERKAELFLIYGFRYSKLEYDDWEVKNKKQEDEIEDHFKVYCFKRTSTVVDKYWLMRRINSGVQIGS